jgi:formylglycine-generating enzyme required for sulfatase activity
VDKDPARENQMRLSPSWFERHDWAVSPAGLTFSRVHGPISFWLGTRDKAEQSGANEFPVWKTIPRSVAISTNEVPYQLFQQFLNETTVNLADTAPRSQQTTGPAIQVTWLEAVQFCSWLNEREGIPVDQWCYPAWQELEQIKGDDRMLSLPDDYLSRTGYRLPTETEWEYFCRAKTESSRYFGPSRSLLNDSAWYLQNSDERPHEAGAFKPNPFGMFGMLGSAWEWCDDVITDFDENERRYAPVDFEHSLEISRHQNRILKGGSYLSLAHNLRSGRSHWGQANVRDNSAGFRIARTLRTPSKEAVQ